MKKRTKDLENKSTTTDKKSDELETRPCNRLVSLKAPSCEMGRFSKPVHMIAYIAHSLLGVWP